MITWRWTNDKAVKLRRSDFLPVGEEQEDEALERGYLSVSSDDDQGPGRECVGADDWGDSPTCCVTLHSCSRSMEVLGRLKIIHWLAIVA